MKGFSTRLLITIGQVGLLVSLLLLARLLGLVPDHRIEIREGRAALAEAVAASSSDFVALNEIHRLEANLRLIVDHNAELLSAALKRSDGYAPAVIGEHSIHWRPMTGEYSTDSQLQVPIYWGRSKWGKLELRFTPIAGSGWLGIMRGPWIKLLLFMGSTGLVVFYIYIGRMLNHLDPSRAIPPQVREALDTMAEGLLVVDHKEQIVLANSAFAAIVGKSPDDLIGFQASNLRWLSHDGSPIAKENSPWGLSLRQGTQQRNALLRLEDANLKQRSFKVNCSPVLGRDGKYGGVLISFDDVTQLEEQKVELSRAMENSEAANRSKSEFLAKMSHEIRTPMNAILGFTDILRRGYSKSEAESKKHLNTIYSSGSHLLELINDILDLSKVESGRLDVERIPFPPHRAIFEVVHVLKVKAQEKAIDLHLEASTSIPEFIESDPARLRQIVTNLIGNAIKFTEQGSVRVVLRMVAGNAARLAIDIVDSGIGMTEAQQKKIFDPFAQADSSVTRRFGGTGLGLTISRQFAEALGGGISVCSEPGKGSTFTVTIDTGPLDGVAFLPPERLLDEERVAATSQRRWRFNSARVLVVDDGEANRDLVTLVLEEAGLVVEGAENGKVGFEKALANPFDVIFMDMQMPVMDGYTATGQLRAKGLTTPIIALTANAMKGFEEKCLAAGCSGYLTKPVDIDKLLETLGELLDGHYVEVESPETILANTQYQEASPPEKEPPIVSSLISNPRFLDVIHKFAARLDEQLVAMESAWATRDFGKLAKLAHWLKGSGGTVGFDAFTSPAAQLESMAQQADVGKTEKALVELRNLAARIQTPANTASWVGSDNEDRHQQKPNPQTGSHPNDALVSRLPAENPRFSGIIEKFSQRLNERLDAMEVAYSDGDLATLAELAHWLKGSGGTVGFNAFTRPATKLERFAKDVVVDEIPSVLAELRELAGRIQLPSSPSTEAKPDDTELVRRPPRFTDSF